MVWLPPIELTGDSDRIKISASDAASDDRCGLFLALKVRPDVDVIGWSKSWAKPKAPFPLGDVVDLVRAAHRSPETSTHQGLTTWLRDRMRQRNIHRCLQVYVQQAVENYLDVHEGTEDLLGELTFISGNPEFRVAEKSLTTWAPTYDSVAGVREVRRLRIGVAHEEPSENDLTWAITSAFVAAKWSKGARLNRIRVVEIGLLDGSISVLFDGSPEEAETAYSTTVRTHIASLKDRTNTVPGRSCGGCKAAGVCSHLTKLKGMLGQRQRGYGTRSVSPTDLETYERCPAQWLMARSLSLPRANGYTAEQARGYAAHEWLKQLHGSGTPCSTSDLSNSWENLESAGIATAEDFTAARPFVHQHSMNCPLERPGVTSLAIEEDLYGYDDAADVVVASRPDLMYLDGDSLVIREFKTVREIPTDGREGVYDKYTQVPFLLAMLNTGLPAKHGAKRGVVEVEFLTDKESVIFSWATDNATELMIANADVRRAVEEWHVDHEWRTKPGPHCAWCPVKRWCPDREVWQQQGADARTADEQPADPTGIAPY